MPRAVEGPRSREPSSSLTSGPSASPGVLATEVRRARLAAGFTQAQVAEELGIHRVNVSLWEVGRQRLTPATASRVLDAIGRLSARRDSDGGSE